MNRAASNGDRSNPEWGCTYANRGRVQEAKGERALAGLRGCLATRSERGVDVRFPRQRARTGRMNRALVELETALKLDAKVLSATGERK
jgi:hypothetical protein